ncbi:hypothetical protein GCM10008024_02860 [Allgaiera indica]|uniref:Transposase IS4-like domain-containing protein n=1 Tax=Allgaiera indica TaxID=765699 RepID=A0AAN4UN20_9RHOB|nr:hypothetical protein GCM10008024_02860 [Allgaiera indica]
MGLAAAHGEQKTIMIEVSRRTPCVRVSLRKDLKSSPDRDQHGREKGGRGRVIGRTKGGMNTKLHAICDSQGRPLNLFVTAGQVSDYIGARALLRSPPDVDWLLGDCGYDADWFRGALKDKGIRACTQVGNSARKL